MAGQGFPGQTQAAHIDGFMHAAKSLGHAEPQESRIAQGSYEFPGDPGAVFFRVALMGAGRHLFGRERLQVMRQIPVMVLEKGPVEVAGISHAWSTHRTR